MAGDALLGREMGRYRIESIIGSGGFATVYRAIDLALERPVALKVVDPTAHRNPTIGRRFVLEGRAVASLDHPAIVPVFDAGENDGVLWMAMRLITGGSLDDALVAGRRLTFDQVAAVIARIADALDHAHGHGVVHRDVKPSNILLEQNDPARAWLADFGIAATARTAGRYTTGALGTAAYMAPEQARPSSVGPPADLYSLGCVAYELLTRRRPFPGDDYVELLVAHATHPVPPTVWPRVDAFVQRALAKDPSARPPSGRAFAEDLRRALAETDRAGHPTAPLPPPPSAPPPSPPASAPSASASPPADHRLAPPPPPRPPSAPPAQRAASAALAAPPSPPGKAGAPSGAPSPPAAPPAGTDADAGASSAPAAPPSPPGKAGAPSGAPSPPAAPPAGTDAEGRFGSGAPAAEDAEAAAGRPPAPPPHRPGDPIGRSSAPPAAEEEPTHTAPATTPPAAGQNSPATSDAPDAGQGNPAALAPTVVEHVDKTLEHPALQPPLAAPPGGSGSGHRPPPPSAPPLGAPPAPRDPTVVRNGRRRARRRLVAGGALLAAGIVAVAVALLVQSPEDRTVDDPAGISYEVPDTWSTDDSRPPEVRLVEDGDTRATVRHQPADGGSAAAQLEAVDPTVCEGRAGDGPEGGISGAEQVAMCTNTSQDLPLVALGAIAEGQFWVITVSPRAAAADRNEFLGSIELRAPTPR